MRLLVPTSVLTLAFALAWDSKDLKLPPPFATPSVDNGAACGGDKPEAAELKLPAGFHVDIYAEGFERPRFMLLGCFPTVIEDVNKPDQRKKLIEGLDRPYGLALWKDYLYVGEQTSIKRYKYEAMNHTVGQGEEVVSLAGLGGGHWTRSLFDSKGEVCHSKIELPFSCEQCHGPGAKLRPADHSPEFLESR